jgi:hypothetical protein
MRHVVKKPISRICLYLSIALSLIVTLRLLLSSNFLPHSTRVLIHLGYKGLLSIAVMEVADLRDAVPIDQATTRTPKSLLSLPNETILKIITFIPFSTETFMNMSMVNHHIHGLISDSKQLLVNEVAEIQFWEAHLIREDNDAHSIASLTSLQEASDLVETVVRATIEDFQALCNEELDQIEVAYLRAGLHVIKSLAGPHTGDFDEYDWSLRFLTLGIKTMLLIRFVSMHLKYVFIARISELPDREQYRERMTRVSLTTAAFESMLLKLGLERFASLFIHAQPFRHNEANAAAIHDFTRSFEAVEYQIPMRWSYCLYNAFGTYPASLGLLSNEERNPAGTLTNVLLFTLASKLEKEPTTLPEASSHLRALIGFASAYHAHEMTTGEIIPFRRHALWKIDRDQFGVQVTAALKYDWFLEIDEFALAGFMAVKDLSAADLLRFLGGQLKYSNLVGPMVAGGLNRFRSLDLPIHIPLFIVDRWLRCLDLAPDELPSKVPN